MMKVMRVARVVRVLRVMGEVNDACEKKDTSARVTLLRLQAHCIPEMSPVDTIAVVVVLCGRGEQTNECLKVKLVLLFIVVMTYANYF